MKQRIQMFDALRGLACLIVIFAHILSTDCTYGLYANGCGKIGVWCFMVMSGFLSFLPFLNDTYTYSITDVIKYYRNKLVKVYPAYLIVLIFAFSIGYIDDLRILGLSLLFGKGEGHFWYMPVIAQFYLIFPIVIYLYFLVKKNDYLFTFFLLSAGALCCILFPFFSYEENSILIFWYLPVFIMGIILSIIWRRVSDKIKPSAWFDIMIFVMVIAILVCTPIFQKLIWNIAPSGWLQNKYLLMGVLWSIIVFCLLFSKKIRLIMENSKILNWIGKISYELYLIHYIILLKIVPIFQNTFIRGVIVVLLSVGLSWILHYSLNYIFGREFQYDKKMQVETAATDINDE